MFGTEFFVDINAIPVQTIERIEVLKDGASAIYGSEAVAGVVNVILKQDVHGVTLDGAWLSTAEGDGAERTLSAAAGWSNESTGVSGTLHYFDRQSIHSRDRAWSRDLDFSNRSGPNLRSSLSSPPTVTLLESERLAADPACPEGGRVAAREVLVPGVVERCRFNWAQFTTQNSPAQRLSATAQAWRNLGGDVEAFVELFFARNDNDSVLAPTPLFGFLVPAEHPGNPFGEHLFLGGRAMDTGDRLLTSKGRSHRLVAGARRHLRGWDLEGAVTASRSRVRELTFNTLLSAPLQEALLGMGAREGNRWYDPFGLNPQNNPEVMDEFRVGETWNRSTTRELTFDVLAQGSLGNIRSRPIGVAAGLQWREQSLDEELDAVQRAGGLAGLALAATPLRAERTISSGFLEVMLPLEHSLELQMALRADRYSDFGSTFNPKLGVAWRAAKPLLLRATWGTSFRPPAFRELADPLVEETAMYQNDPWRCPATGAFFDCFGDLVPLTRRGNPDLDPELGTTVVLGLLWERAVASAARVSLDVWRIEHEDRITLASLSDQTLLEQVPPDRNPFVVRATPTPADVAPGVPGRITALTDTYFNADRLDTRGVDAEGTLTWGDGATGEVTARLTYTYLDRFALGLDFAGVNAAENLAGGLGVFGPLPRHRGTFALSWQRGRNGATGRLHYAGSYRSTTNVFENGLETNMPFRVDAWWSLDLQYSYRMARLNDAILRVGCQNCTDEDPPTYNDTISGANIHDGRGAIVYVGWSQPF